MFRLPLQPMWDQDLTMFQHTLGVWLGSDTICVSLSSPLVDIVLFKLFLTDFPQEFLKRVTREVSTPNKNKKCFVPLSNYCGISHIGYIKK